MTRGARRLYTFATGTGESVGRGVRCVPDLDWLRGGPRLVGGDLS